MLLRIEGAELFDPAPRGAVDVLVGGGRVLAIGDAALSVPADEVVDGRGRVLLPGIVDALTHPCGGGGEGGFGNRTAELDAETFIRAGVTSPVGALGTDSLGRSLEVLFGNVMGLRAQGLRAFMYTGAYRVPAPTLTGDVARDLYLVDPVVGVGEVAIADHRGTQPTALELRRLAAEAQLGGLLAGRGGTVLIHVGNDTIEHSDLSPSLLFPTHVNRSRALLDEAAEWALQSGWVDITVSTTDELIAAGDIPAQAALKRLLEAGAPTDRITLSSDAGGSLPVYVAGELQGLTAASPASLPAFLAEIWREERSLFSIALAGVTANPAAALRIPGCGSIAVGRSADMLLMDPDSGSVHDLMCAGNWLLRDGVLRD
jgi:beta-aspartyl-dipeptidase (metallo-type)